MFRNILKYSPDNICKVQKCCMSRLSNEEIKLRKNIRKNELPIFHYGSQNNRTRVYVWGLADTGALGVRNITPGTEYRVKLPRKLGFAERHQVKDVTCGFGFTVYTIESSDEIKLYGTGINTDGQIGYHESRNKKPLELLLFAAPIMLPSPADAKTKILKTSAGRAHLLVLTTDGLFCLGNNAYGQCGRKIIPNEKYLGSSSILHIPNIEGQKIVDIQSGQDHSIILTDYGNVYATGWGADGQTGLGHCKNTDKFTKVTGDIQGENIIKVSSAGDCILALNDKNELFGWGNSEYGQLEKDHTQVTRSVYLPFCKNLGNIIDIASGGSFCMVLNDEGTVYVWGYGILGRGTDINYPEPWPIDSSLFLFNDFQPDNKIASINCGVSHLAVITTLGELFMWGKNRNGCLGVGHLDNQLFPRKIAVGASVLKVACGLDHTVAICRPFA